MTDHVGTHPISTGESDQPLPLAEEILVDPNLHTDLRMRLEQELSRLQEPGAPALAFPNGRAVADVMHPGVVTCLPDAEIPMLASIMVGYGVHALVVAGDEHPSPILFSDLDLIAAALERPEAYAAQIAREPAATIQADASAAEAVIAMATKLAPHLLVTQPVSGVAAGMISSLDVIAMLGSYPPGLARIARPAPARPSVSAQTLAQARAGDVGHPGIVTCAAESPLQTVARSMAEHRIHCMAVSGVEPVRQRLIWGTVTTMDLIRAVARGAWERPAATIAEERPIAVNREESLERVASLMVERSTSHVVVVDASGWPAAMISSLDVARVLAASV